MTTAINIEEISGEIDGGGIETVGTRGQIKAAVDWLSKRRNELRPWGDFINTKRFSKPKDIAEVAKRVMKNLEQYQTNYMMICLGLVAYCIISSPLLLFALSLSMGACFYISQKGQGQSIRLFGRSFSVTEQYGLVLMISLPLFFLASAGSAVFWIIGASVFIIGVHASLLSISGEALPELEMDPVN